MFIIDDIINAILGNKAAGDASRAQQDQINKALNLQGDIWRQQRGDQAPYMQAGQQGVTSMMDLLRDPNSIQNSPAFQFRMQQGQQALERSAAAKGNLMGGGFAKGLTRYSQGLASDEYGNQFNRLMGVSQLGQNSANSLGAMGSNYANSASNLYGALGNAQSAGIMGQANATMKGVSDGFQSAGNIAMMGLGGAGMLKGLGIPGFGASASMGGGGGASTGYVANYIPRQSGYGGG